MFKKKILFFVGRSYLVESASYLSFELRKNGFLTSIFCPFLDNKYKKSFDNVFYYFNLDNFLISIVGLPFFFFYLAYLVWISNCVVIYQVKLAFLIKFWCILFSKKFYIIHSNAHFSSLNNLLSKYATILFYIFPTSNIPHKNAILTSLPLSSRYKFDFIRAPKDQLIITFFIDSFEIASILKEMELLLNAETRDKIILNLILNNDIHLTSAFKVNVYKNFNDYDLIKQSHLIICYANSLMLAKICAIGRPVFLIYSQNMKVNFMHFLQLKGGFSGDINVLVQKINDYFCNEEIFYKDSELNLGVFCDVSIKDLIVY